MKICEDWDVEEVMYATCPYCSYELEEHNWFPNDKYTEKCPRCDKQFILGQK